MHTAHAGLPYEAVLQTLPAELTLADGTLQDRRRRLVEITLKVLDSRGGRVGAGESRQDRLVPAQAAQYDAPGPLETRDFKKVFSSSHTAFPSVTFRQDAPLPVTVLALTTRIC